MSTLTIKGQVTVPKPVRDRLGLKPGDEVTFDLAEDGRVFVAKARGKTRRSRFANLRGIAGRGLTTDEILVLTRGE